MTLRLESRNCIEHWDKNKLEARNSYVRQTESSDLMTVVPFGLELSRDGKLSWYPQSRRWAGTLADASRRPCA